MPYIIQVAANSNIVSQSFVFFNAQVRMLLLEHKIVYIEERRVILFFKTSIYATP